jgi:hypothetical protein
LLGKDSDFDLAFFNIKDCVGVIALRKDDFVLVMLCNGSALGRSFKEQGRVKPPRASRLFGDYALLVHLGSLPT